MARKRKNLRHLSTAGYWEERLAREGLTMSAGLDPGHDKLVYVGDSNDLIRISDVSISDVGHVRKAEIE